MGRRRAWCLNKSELGDRLESIDMKLTSRVKLSSKILQPTCVVPTASPQIALHTFLVFTISDLTFVLAHDGRSEFPEFSKLFWSSGLGLECTLWSAFLEYASSCERFEEGHVACPQHRVIA